VGVGFSAPLKTDPESHTASSTMDIVYLAHVERPARGVNRYPESRLKKKYSYVSTPPLGLQGLL